MKTFKELKKAFKDKGWKLEKFKGFYGIGYYQLEIGKEEYNDWLWVGSSLVDVEQAVRRR